MGEMTLTQMRQTNLTNIDFTLVAKEIFISIKLKKPLSVEKLEKLLISKIEGKIISIERVLKMKNYEH